jgi:hypothetical protein
MEPSEESGRLPMEVDAWEKEASPARVSSRMSSGAPKDPGRPGARGCVRDGP